MLSDILQSLGFSIIACSGGLDSLLLSTVACRQSRDKFVVVHAIGPAVPLAATERVTKLATQEGWNFHLAKSREFGDPKYLENPINRCYYCKSHLYSSLREIVIQMNVSPSCSLLSGANIDDLDEYRPGLDAAKEIGVRHPFIEASMGKREIRALAHELGLFFADLPASPCLASRLYTGTEVTRERLRAVEAGEELIRSRKGIEVVRCRLRGNDMLIEVPSDDQAKIDSVLLDEVFAVAIQKLPQIGSVRLDPRPYKSGRAFIGHSVIEMPTFD